MIDKGNLMLSLFEKIKKIWVLEYYFESTESKIEGKLLVNSDTEESAIEKFRDYFSTYEKSFSIINQYCYLKTILIKVKNQNYYV